MEKVGFNGHIALAVETLTNNYMKRNGCEIAVTPDMIEAGSFIPIILLILCNKYGRTAAVVAFLEEACEYMGRSGCYA